MLHRSLLSHLEVAKRARCRACGCRGVRLQLHSSALRRVKQALECLCCYHAIVPVQQSAGGQAFLWHNRATTYEAKSYCKSWLAGTEVCGVGVVAQLVPQVTELVISELLWLNYSNPEKPVYLYLHSMGSQTPDGQVTPHSCQHSIATLPCSLINLLHLQRRPSISMHVN